LFQLNKTDLNTYFFSFNFDLQLALDFRSISVFEKFGGSIDEKIVSSPYLSILID